MSFKILSVSEDLQTTSNSCNGKSLFQADVKHDKLDGRRRRGNKMCFETANCAEEMPPRVVTCVMYESISLTPEESWILYVPGEMPLSSASAAIFDYRRRLICRLILFPKIKRQTEDSMPAEQRLYRI